MKVIFYGINQRKPDTYNGKVIYNKAPYWLLKKAVDRTGREIYYITGKKNQNIIYADILYDFNEDVKGKVSKILDKAGDPFISLIDAFKSAGIPYEIRGDISPPKPSQPAPDKKEEQPIIPEERQKEQEKEKSKILFIVAGIILITSAILIWFFFLRK